MGGCSTISWPLLGIIIKIFLPKSHNLQNGTLTYWFVSLVRGEIEHLFKKLPDCVCFSMNSLLMSFVHLFYLVIVYILICKSYFVKKINPWTRLCPTPVLLPGKSYGWRSLVGCSPWGRKKLDTTEWLHFHFSLSCIGEGNGNPLQGSCLENHRDRGAWWAAVYGVTQSWTWLSNWTELNWTEGPFAWSSMAPWLLLY